MKVLGAGTPQNGSIGRRIAFRILDVFQRLLTQHGIMQLLCRKVTAGGKV